MGKQEIIQLKREWGRIFLSEKICANHVYGKELVSGIHKELLQLNEKRDRQTDREGERIAPFKNGRRICTDISVKIDPRPAST